MGWMTWWVCCGGKEEGGLGGGRHFGVKRGGWKLKMSKDECKIKCAIRSRKGV